MAEPTTNPTFQEVLQVDIDASLFTSGLNKLTGLYQNWLSEMSAKGIQGKDLLGVSVLGDVQGKLDKLTTSLTEFAQELRTKLGIVFDSMKDGLDELDKKAGSTGKKRSDIPTVRETNALLAEDTTRADVERLAALDEADKQQQKFDDEAAKRDWERLQTRNKNLADADKERERLEGETLDRVEKLNDESTKADVERLNARTKAVKDANDKANKLALDQQKAEGSYLAKNTVETNKFVASKQAALETLDSRIGEIADQRTKAEARQGDLDKKYLAAKLSGEHSTRVNAAERVGILNQQVAARLVTIEAELQSTRLSILSATTQKEVDEYTRKYTRLLSEAQSFSRKIQAAEAGQEFLRKPNSGSNRFFAQLAKDLPEAIANIVRFQLVWAVAAAVVYKATDLVKAFFDQFRQGWAYLSRVNESAEQMQAVLEGTVKYSSNVAANLQMTGEAARETVKYLEELAIKGNLKPEVMTRGMESFGEAGGFALVKNMREAANFTQLFAMALRASGVSARLTQRIVSEMKDFLEGNLKTSSKFLEVTGLTATEARAIVENAKNHKDLLDQILPRLEQFKNFTADANGRMDELSKQLQLIKERLAGSVMQETYNDTIKSLQQVLGWTNRNTDSMKVYADWAGKAVSVLAKMAVASYAIILQPFTLAALALKSMVESGQWIKSNFGTPNTDKTILDTNFVQAKPALQAELVRAKASFENDRKNILSKYKAEAAEEIRINGRKSAQLQVIADQQKKAELDLIATYLEQVKALTFLDETQKKFFTDRLARARNEAESRKVPGSSAAAYPGQQELEKLRTEFREAIAETEKEYSYFRQRLETAKTDGLISEVQYFDQLTSSVEDERRTLEAYAKTFGELGKKVKDVRPGSAERFIGNITTDVTNQNKQLTVVAEGATRELLKTNQRMVKDDLDSRMTMESDAAKARLALLRDEMQQGYVLRTTYLEREQQVLDQEYYGKGAVLALEFKEAGSNLEKQSQVINKIKTADATYTAASEANAAARKFAWLEDMQTLHAMESATGDVAQQQMQADSALTLSRGASVKQIYDANMRLLASEMKLLDARIAAKQAELQEAQARAKAAGATDQEAIKVRQLTNELSALNAARTGVAAKQSSVEGKAPTVGQGLLSSLFGKDSEGNPFQSLGDAFGASASGLDKLTVAATSVGNVFNVLQGAVGAVIQGYQQGGVAGAIGAGMSQVGAMMPGTPWGAVLSTVGPIVSLVGSLFKRAAKKIADNISKDIEGIMKSYRNGEITMIETINRLEAERQDAISRLSGKKGGKSELDKLLPGLEDQIASLKKEQKDILDTFEKELGYLKLHSDELETFAQAWDDINKKVKEYLGAGGKVADANAYLSLQLGKLREQAAQSLTDEEANAVQDAIKLNDLLQQRITLVTEWKQKEFDIISADALERRQSSAVKAGQELQKQRIEYEKQLADLDSQIRIETVRVDKEREVFNLSTDIATLHRRDEELQIAAIDLQISKMKDLQKIVNAIYQKPGGSWAVNPSSGLSIGTIQVNVNTGGAPADGRRIADDMMREIQRQRRLGTGAYGAYA